MTDTRATLFVPLILAVSFLMGASTLLSPDKVATFRALYYVASQSENEFYRYHDNREPHAQSELNRSAPIFSLLYQQYGHTESLRRAIRLYRIAEKEPLYNVPYSGTNARGDITVTLNWLWNVRHPLFRGKYRMYNLIISNDTMSDLELQGVGIALELVNGEVLKPVDLRSDPVLWENVKNSLPSYYLQRVRRTEEASTRAVFPSFKENIRYAHIDLGSHGKITIPFLQNLYPDLE
ncbi:MAG: hypothetical protein V2G42_06325 [bacterium JZ-2024 1]